MNALNRKLKHSPLCMSSDYMGWYLRIAHGRTYCLHLEMFLRKETIYPFTINILLGSLILGSLPFPFSCKWCYMPCCFSTVMLYREIQSSYTLTFRWSSSNRMSVTNFAMYLVPAVGESSGINTDFKVFNTACFRKTSQARKLIISQLTNFCRKFAVQVLLTSLGLHCEN